MAPSRTRCLLFVHGRRTHGRPSPGAPCRAGGSVWSAQEQWESLARRLATAFRVSVHTTRPAVRSAAVALAASTGTRPAVCDVEAYAARRLAADLAARGRPAAS